jgi:RNA polymerase primary sigma factor
MMSTIDGRPDRAILLPATAPPGAEAEIPIGRSGCRDARFEVLAAGFGDTRPGLHQAPSARRARRILDVRLRFVPHPSFDDPAQHEQILEQMPEPADGRAPLRSKATEGLPPYLAGLYEVPLLGREQEIHLFRKMNFLKYLANQLRDEVDPGRADSTMLDRIEEIQGEAQAVKNQIIRANLRLVVSIVKRHVGPSNHFFELVSDGNMSLIRAVEEFDYARGNRFSTYASWAIKRNLARNIRKERLRRDRFVTGHGEKIEAAAADRTDEHEHEHESELEQMEALMRMLVKLDDRERKIITSRFGLDGTGEKTLDRLGKELGITKERVRQLEARARDRLRKLAAAQKLDLRVS